jgi:two pore calcium channel protein 3
MEKTFPKKDSNFFELVWLVIDQDDVGHVDLKSFTDIYELTHLSVKSLADGNSLADKCCPKVYNSKYSKIFVRCVKHIYFRYFFDLAIFANAIFIGFELDGGEWFFLTIFTLEIVSKLYAFGGFEFVQKLWNIFDVIVVGSALIISLLKLAVG